jgi:hypothetical protein
MRTRPQNKLIAYSAALDRIRKGQGADDGSKGLIAPGSRRPLTINNTYIPWDLTIGL